jgi:HEAT repeat protein
MRTLVLFLVGCFLFGGISAYAQGVSEGAKPFTHATIEQSEQSLVKALESNSPGLQISAAATARELKQMFPDRAFSRLVNPLMGIVKNEDADRNARIVAAIALHELRSDKGDYAIKAMAHFTSDERVAYICSWLTRYRMEEANPDLASGNNQAVTVSANAK